jgi:hypothetical protein
VLGSRQAAEYADKADERGPHAITPPFFQATIAKSPQSNCHHHKTTLRKQATARESVFADLGNKRSVHSIAGVPGFLATVALRSSLKA